MKLYGYWASSATYRVRIALNLKGVDYEIVPVDLRAGDGEHNTEAYRKLNPHARVPTLVLNDGAALTQSMAIVQWLDRTRPEPAFLPEDPIAAARAMSFAQTIVSDIQPLHVNKVLRRLKSIGGLGDAEVAEWARLWIRQGLQSLESMLAARAEAGPFAFGEKPGLAEITLIPQLFKARDFDLDLSQFPILMQIEAAATALPAFARAAPEVQPGAPEA